MKRFNPESSSNFPETALARILFGLIRQIRQIRLIGLIGVCRVARLADRVGTVEPPTEVDQLASFATEGPKGGLFFLVHSNALATSWAFIGRHGRVVPGVEL